MSLQDRLANSESFASLLSEKRVQKLCVQNQWETTHSAYYSDPDTKKLREIDIVARKTWEKKSKNISIFNFLVIECKSNKGYSVLLTGEDLRTPFLRQRNFWVGNEHYNRYSKLKEILLAEQIPITAIKEILTEFEKFAFPDAQSLLYNYFPRLNELDEYNAFKETNSQQIRDNEASVVWKSFQSLTSCIDGFFESRWEYVISNLHSDIQYRGKDDVVSTVLNSLANSVGTALLMHPILVVDSPLFTIENQNLMSINWGRLVRKNMFGNTESWIDIVNSDFIEDYIISLDKFYSSFFKKQKLARK